MNARSIDMAAADRFSLHGRRLGAALAACVALLAGAPLGGVAADGNSGHHDVVGWSPQAIPALGLEPSGTLTAISCLRASSCVGVGYSRNTQGVYVTLVERWDGSAWSIESSPNPEGNSNAFLTAVRCFDATSCVAVGHYVKPSGRRVPLSERWSGHLWEIEGMPSPAGLDVTLTSLACASVDACTAVGYAQAPATRDGAVAYHWNGSAWRTQSVQGQPGGIGSRLTSVSCASPTDCVAVGLSGGKTWLEGQLLAARWDGASWSLSSPAAVPGASTSAFNSVSCPSATACLAVGAWNGSKKASGAVAERWDGSAWTVQATPTGRQDQLKVVSCSSVTACVALGTYSGPTVALRWDGVSWVGLPPTFAGDAGLSCTGATSCTSVGGADGSGSAAAWDGSTWSGQSISYRRGAAFSNLHDVSCVSESECVAVGQYATSAGSVLPTIQRWKNDRWRLEPTDFVPDSLLSAVSCVSSDDCTAVGDTPTAGGFGYHSAPVATHWDGSKWQVQPTPVTPWPSALLKHVSCTRTGADGRRDHATVCTAVGFGRDNNGNSGGIAERWDGATWQLQAVAIPPGGAAELQGISCPTTTECHVVGKVYIDPGCSNCTGDPTQQPPPGPCSSGCFAEQYWDGSRWTYQMMPSRGTERGSYEQVLGISCPAPGTCVAVGYFWFGPTFAQRLTAGSWAVQQTPDPNGWEAVSCVTINSCTSVGEGASGSVGLATHLDGSRWSDQPVPTPPGAAIAGLDSVSCPTARMCMAVGGQVRSNPANSDSGPGLALAELYTDGEN